MSKYQKSATFEISRKAIEFANLEKTLSIQFPLEYKEFVTNYRVGQFVEIWPAYLDDFLRPTPMYKIRIPTDHGVFSYNWLNSVAQIEYDYNHYPESQELFASHHIIRVGDIVEQGGLYIGVGSDNTGCIYKYLLNEDEAPVKIFNDINALLDSLVLEKEDDLPQLARNSGRYAIPEDHAVAESDLLHSLKTLEPNEAWKDASTMLNDIKKAIQDVRGEDR